MAKAGRPSSFDPKIAAKICERLAMDESLVSICLDEGMPHVTTVYRWRDANDQFREDYARARVDQGHTVADVIGDIRKRIISGELEPNAGKAAGDLAKWEASRRAARDFGDKIDVTSAGEKLDAGVITDPVARAARLASIAAEIEAGRNAAD